jgi:hypothetical protein
MPNPSATPGDKTPPSPLKRNRAAIPLAIVLAAGGIWTGCFLNAIFYAGMEANDVKSYYGHGIDLCRAELFLRAAAV